MITPMEVRKVNSLTKLYLEAERHIDAALKKGANKNSFSTRLYWLTDLDPRELADRYRAVGWRAEVVSDPREGDYLEISP